MRAIPYQLPAHQCPCATVEPQTLETYSPTMDGSPPPEDQVYCYICPRCGTEYESMDEVREKRRAYDAEPPRVWHARQRPAAIRTRPHPLPVGAACSSCQFWRRPAPQARVPRGQCHITRGAAHAAGVCDSWTRKVDE